MNFPAKTLVARLIPDTPRADLYTHTHKTFWETFLPQSLACFVSRQGCLLDLVILFLCKGKEPPPTFFPSLPSSSLPLSPSGWQDSSGRACNQFAGRSHSQRKDAEAQSEGAPLQVAGDRGPGSGQNQHHQTLCPPELLPPLPGHHRSRLCLEGAELGC